MIILINKIFLQVRYCPSLESKIIRFNKDRHQIWLEPEGFDNHIVYPQGMSCSLPGEYQQKLFNQIPGLENAKLIQFGINELAKTLIFIHKI